MCVLSIFKKRSSGNNNILFDKIKWEIENQSLISRQRREDIEYEKDVSETAIDNIRKWNNLPDMIINGKLLGKAGLIISVPKRCFYHIYHEPTAKYKKSNFNELVELKMKEIELNSSIK